MGLRSLLTRRARTTANVIAAGFVTCVTCLVAAASFVPGAAAVIAWTILGLVFFGMIVGMALLLRDEVYDELRRRSRRSRR